MTLNELKNKLSSEGRVIGSLQIICGRKCESPDVMGIYEEDGIWYVYHTDDRGGIVVVDEGNENDMTEDLYRRVLKEKKWYVKKWYLKREMKSSVFAIYQGKKFTSGIDQNGKVILRSTDIEDVDNGFEKCEPYKYRREEKPVVCIKWVEPQEIEKYYRVYTGASYCGFDFEVIGENEQKVSIIAVDGDYRNWEALGMKCIDKGLYQKWVNKSEVKIETKEEPLKL